MSYCRSASSRLAKPENRSSGSHSSGCWGISASGRLQTIALHNQRVSFCWVQAETANPAKRDYEYRYIVPHLKKVISLPMFTRGTNFLPDTGLPRVSTPTGGVDHEDLGPNHSGVPAAHRGA